MTLQQSIRLQQYVYEQLLGDSSDVLPLSIFNTHYSQEALRLNISIMFLKGNLGNISAAI